MFSKIDKNSVRKARHHRQRRNLNGTCERPRLNVYRSTNHIYAQIIDDEVGNTLVAASTLDAEIRGELSEKTKTEAAKLVGELIGKRALEKGVKQVVITMGALGAFATDGQKSELVSRLNVKSIDTTGAGDAFNGGFVTALAEGKDLFTALRYGNVTGALSVTKLGTAPAMPYKEEIQELYHKAYE